MNKILFRCNGGVGKNIVATAVVQQLKKKYPDSKIYVQASYPKVFSNLPFVDKYFPLEPVPYFYEEIKDFEIVNIEPYEDLKFEKGNEHLIDTWCRMLQLESPIKKKGIINLSEQEKVIGKNFIMQLRSDRPIVALQISGGTSHYRPQDAFDPTRVKHTRDLPIEIAQEIVDRLIQKGYAVLHISLPTEPKLKNTYQLDQNNVMNLRHLFALLNECHGLISIDSMMQHAWTALGKENAVVLWGGTNPTNLGYSSNSNLVNRDSCDDIHCNRPSTFRFDFMGDGEIWKCPFDGKCMKSFKPEQVVEAFIGATSKKDGMKAPAGTV